MRLPARQRRRRHVEHAQPSTHPERLPLLMDARVLNALRITAKI